MLPLFPPPYLVALCLPQFATRSLLQSLLLLSSICLLIILDWSGASSPGFISSASFYSRSLLARLTPCTQRSFTFVDGDCDWLHWSFEKTTRHDLHDTFAQFWSTFARPICHRCWHFVHTVLALLFRTSICFSTDWFRAALVLGKKCYPALTPLKESLWSFDSLFVQYYLACTFFCRLNTHFLNCPNWANEWMNGVLGALQCAHCALALLTRAFCLLCNVSCLFRWLTWWKSLVGATVEETVAAFVHSIAAESAAAMFGWWCAQRAGCLLQLNGCQL